MCSDKYDTILFCFINNISDSIIFELNEHQVTEYQPKRITKKRYSFTTVFWHWHD